MFGHDYSDEELKALHAIREEELFGSISPAGIHNDDNMYPCSSKSTETNVDYKLRYFALLRKYRQLVKKKGR